MKRFLAVLLTVIMVGVLITGCMDSENTDDPMENDGGNEVVITEGENPIEGYDIGVTAPKEWSGSTAIVEIEPEGEAVAAFGVELIIENTPQKGCYLAIISVFDETTWRDMDGADKFGQDEIFATKGQMYVVSPQQNPFDDGTDNYEIFQSLMKDYDAEMFYSTAADELNL